MKKASLNRTFPIYLICFWLIVLGKVFKSSLPLPTNDDIVSKSAFFTFMPQGWGFFTRNPREDQLLVFKLEAGKPHEVTQTNNCLDNYLGASRKNRLVSLEINSLLVQLDDSLWHTRDGHKLIFDKSLLGDTVRNGMRPLTIEGDYFFVKQERVPWAWSEDFEKIVMPYRYIKVHVKRS